MSSYTPKCGKRKYTLIEGNSRLSTKNFLVTHDIITVDNKVKDQNELFRASNWLLDIAKTYGYFKDIPVKVEPDGVTVKYDDAFFKKIDGIKLQIEKNKKKFGEQGELDFGDVVAIKSGVLELFESKPELANIGTLEQYSQYLNTVFPDSKVKDIVYHGSKEKFDKFDKFKLKENVETALSKIGFNFVNSKKIASKYGSIKSVIINITNPKEINIRDIEVPLEVRSHYESYYASKLKNIKEDGAILEFPDGQEEYIIFKPEQIHILGSKQDIEGFKKFVKSSIENKTTQDLNIREKYFKDSPVTNSVDILTKIGDSNHPLAPLAKQLIKYAKLNNSTIILDSADYIMVNGIQASGVYKSKTGDIQIAEFAYLRGKGIEPTLIHEILHSLTYNALKDNSQIKQDLEKLFKVAKSELSDEYALTNLDEFTVALFSDAKFIQKLMEVKATNETKYKNLLEEVFDYILNLFGISKTDNLYSEAFAIATNLLDYAADKNLYYNTLETYEELGDMSAYVHQLDEYEKRTGNKATRVMKEVIDKLYNSDLSLTENQEHYTNSKGELYQRVGDYIKSIGFKINGEVVPNYFEFGGNEEDYAANRDWGNQIDRVLTKVVEGATIDEVLLDWSNQNILKGYENRVSKDTIKDAYNQFKEFIDNYDKNAILIPQITVKSDKYKVAGTTDLIAVYPDGLIKVIDLKSSIKSTTERDNKGKVLYTTVFHKKDGTVRASKKQRHTAQLSSYKALLMSMGVDFKNEDELSILPMHIEELEGTEVTKVALEEPVKIDAYKQIIDNLYTGEQTKEVPKNLIDNIKLLLKTRELSLKHQSSIKNIKWKKWQLEKLQKEIRLVEDTKAITDFIDNAYETIVKSENFGKTYNGIIYEVNNIINKINKKELSSIESINELYYYKALLDNYKPIIDELSDYFRTEIGYGNEAKENTPLWKLEKIVTTSNEVESLYYKKVLPEIAGIMAKQVPESLTADVKKVIKQKEETIQRLTKEGKSEKYIKKIQDSITDIKRSVGNSFEENKAIILRELIQGSHRDIGSLDAWLVHGTGTNNLVLSTFVKTILEKLENARLASLDFEREAVKIFEEFKGTKSSDNPTSFNKDFIEEVTGGNGIKTLHFVQPLDVNAYNIEKQKVIKAVEENPNDSKRLWSEFYKENHIALPEKDVTITNPVTKEEVVLIRGKENLREDYRQMYKNKIINYRDLETFIGSEDKLGSIDYLTTPDFNKFASKKYQEIQKSKEKKKYYDYLVASYFKSQEVIPLENRNSYRLPSINKSAKDSMIDDPLNYGKKSVQDLVKVLPKDEQQFGAISDKTVEKVLNEQQESLKTIPVLFSSYMPIEDVSTDLITSVISYNTAAMKYKAQSEMAAFSNVALETVQKNAPLKQNTIKENVLDAVSKALGVSEETIKNRKKALGDNNIATAMAAIIDMHIYGKNSIRKTMNVPVVGEVELNKLVGKLMSFASFTQIGGNPLLSLVNYLNGNIQMTIEAAAGKYFTPQEFASAKFTYDKAIADGTFIKDFVEPINKSFLGQLIDLYDPVQGEFKDLFGRKIGQSAAKKLVSRDTWFFMQQMGEHSFPVQAMIAMLKRTQVKQGDKTISLWKAYEMKEGKLTLKEGVVLPGNVSENGLVALDIQNTMHGINKSLHGVYNSFDKIALERHWFGKLITMYKKFFVPGIRRRYRSEGIDYETGIVTEGFYRTFYKLMIKDTKQMMKYLTFQNNELTDLEKQNVKRALTEMSIIMVTGALTMLLTAKIKDMDDDDEKRRMRYLLYLSMRMNAEIGVFGGLGDPQNLFILPNLREMKQVVRQPFALWSVIDKLFRFLNQLQHPTEKYKRDSGIFEKGDNKAIAAFLKLWGYSGINFEPQVGIQFLQMNTK